MEKVSGKAHKQSFEVSCTIPELDTTTTGRGLTRRDAEQEAALAMLDAVDKIE
jgi:ribonuclease-3